MKKRISSLLVLTVLAGCSSSPSQRYTLNYNDPEVMFRQNGGLDRNARYYKGYSPISNSDVKHQLKTNPLEAYAVGAKVMQIRGHEAYRQAQGVKRLIIKPRLPNRSHTPSLNSWSIFIEKQDDEYLKDAAAYRFKHLAGNILFLGFNPHCSSCGANFFNNTVKSHITEYSKSHRIQPTLLTNCSLVGAKGSDVEMSNYDAYGASGQAHYYCLMAGMGWKHARYGAYSGDDNMGGGVRYFLEIAEELPFSEYPFLTRKAEGMNFLDGISPETFGNALQLYAKGHHLNVTAYSYDDPENERFVISATTGKLKTDAYIPYKVYYEILDKYKDRIARFEANLYQKPYD